MNIEIFNAKNGEKTCTYKGKALHSTYNPSTESSRYVASLNPLFKPKNIIVTGGALSYLVKDLKDKFHCNTYAIRYSHDFDDYNSYYDKVFYYNEELEQNLISLGEENISQTFFVPWKASSIAYQEEDHKTWEIIKKVSDYTKTLLTTRSYFEKIWLKNSFLNAINMRRISIPTSGSKPIVLCGSGPSLETMLQDLQKYRHRINIVACSSSIGPLLDNNIIPDLAISTDGGFYAKSHLLKLKSASIPLALSVEGKCPLEILNYKEIIPLTYEDGFESLLFHELNIPHIRAERNGTVTGTALSLCMKLTNEKIFLCGIDLCVTNGKSHISGNELSKDIQYSRLNNQETSCTRSRYSQSSLSIYEDWFTYNSKYFYKRVFRLSRDFPYSNKLGLIEDVGPDFFYSSFTDGKDISFKVSTIADNLKPKALAFLHKYMNCPQWKRSLFPTKFISMNTSIEEKKIKLQKDIEEKNLTLVNQIERMLK